MRYTTLKNFPKDFMWGASTSAYQVEGANREDGNGLSCQDIKSVPKDTSSLEVCSDHYHRYKEDIALMAEMGLKAYRFSIAWTRILPDGDGEINPKGLEYYHNVIDECQKYNIEPIVTLFHFDMPAKLDEKGSWSNPESINWFVNYCEILFKEYKDKVKYWLTINEQNILTLVGSVIGTLHIPENCTNILKEVYQQNHHMLIAQAKAMKLCHELNPEAKIGPAPNISLIYPKSCKPEDITAAQNANALRNWLYLDAYVYGRYNPIVLAWLKENNALPTISKEDIEILENAHPDFIGVNYYNTAVAKEYIESEANEKSISQQENKGEKNFFDGTSNPYLENTQFGWSIDPVGFRNTLREIYTKYNLPILITENGLGAYDTLDENNEIHDQYRINYYKKHIKQLHLSISDGCEIIGYCPWSAIDLISTHEGMKKRYGFVYVNRDEFDLKDLNRFKKDSFYWYKKVIASNGADLK